MTLEQEASVLSMYLIKKSPTCQVVGLYAHAIQILNLSITNREKKVWDFVLKYPWLLSYLDAGLAVNFPNSNLRRRILVLLSILETQAEYHSIFLPVRRPALYILVMPYFIVRATFKLIAGKVFVWLILQK